jgi:Fur family ferric uptake transcriptional regulator
MSSTGSQPSSTTGSVRTAERWAGARDQLHARGLRWTPQRRMLVDVLSRTDGHVTGAELVERCRRYDPSTIPSTVYRTLDVLEELGLVRHAHGPDGREEYHILPDAEHGHLHCAGCGGSWDIGPTEAAGLSQALESGRGFRMDLSHLTVSGLCAACAQGADAGR